MDDEHWFLLVMLGAFLIIRARKRRQERRRERRWWVRPWIRRREELGEYHRLMRELQLEDRDAFKEYMRMSPEEFFEILDRVGPRIKRQDTTFRKALDPGLKLAATLRFLAAGNSLRSMRFSFRIGLSSLSKFLPEVCQAIVDMYADEVMVMPDTPEKWKTVAQDFEEKWNLPHCIGAIDGKHIAIRNPPGGASQYYNYKGFYSVVLMAVVDAHYRFLYVNVGATGSGSDGGVFADTLLKEQLEADDLGIPPAEPLTEDGPDVAYFLVGDEAFPLRKWLMKPLPRRGLSHEERIYNYRISRARRVVENAFGIMSSKWRALMHALPLFPEKIPVIVTACCILHNLLLKNRLRENPNLADRENADHEVMGGEWRNEDGNMESLRPAYGNVATQVAKRQRQYLVDYVNSEEGSVPWQEDMV